MQHGKLPPSSSSYSQLYVRCYIYETDRLLCSEADRSYKTLNHTDLYTLTLMAYLIPWWPNSLEKSPFTNNCWSWVCIRKGLTASYNRFTLSHHWCPALIHLRSTCLLTRSAGKGEKLFRSMPPLSSPNHSLPSEGGTNLDTFQLEVPIFCSNILLPESTKQRAEWNRHLLSKLHECHSCDLSWLVPIWIN